MKRILLVILVLVLGVQSKADELINGSFSKLGLNFAYLAHNAGKSHIDSLHIALHYDSYSIFENGFVWGSDAMLGGSTGNINKHYPLQGTENLTSQKSPVGSVNLFFDGLIYVGYSLIRRSIDMPLYIGTGYKFATFLSVSINTPAVGQILASYLPIELRGDIRVRPRVAFEYLLAYDIGLSQSLLVQYDAGDNKRNLSMNRGYGLRLSVGGRYYVSKETFFYANILASYQSFGASESATISIAQPPAGSSGTPGYLPGSAVVSYPRSSISYVGLRFGIGF